MQKHSQKRLGCSHDRSPDCSLFVFGSHSSIFGESLSEPLFEGTFVSAENKDKLLEVAEDTKWRKVLETIAKMVRARGLSAIIPQIDHGRIKFFVKYWKEKEQEFKWLQPVLEAFAGA